MSNENLSGLLVAIEIGGGVPEEFRPLPKKNYREWSNGIGRGIGG
jgi:hypothetical protein